MTWHIRKAGKMRADKRFRTLFTKSHTGRAIVNRHGTICGAEPTADDKDRDTAAHLIKHAAIPQLAHWTDGICEACREAL